MEKTKNIINLFKEEYALSLSSPKWISTGGQILRYIGQSVVLVKFTKDSVDEQEWKTTTEVVDIIGISGYEPLTGTYLIAWKSSDSEAQSERLTPEGFSFNIPERDLWMHRFLPLSLHMEITEATRSYERFKGLFTEKSSLSLEEIVKYCSGKQKETVGYKNYISLIVDTTDGLGVGVTEFRIKSFSNPQKSGRDHYIVGLRDPHDNLILCRIPTERFTEAFDLSIGDTYIGKAKIINIQG